MCKKTQEEIKTLRITLKEKIEMIGKKSKLKNIILVKELKNAI